MSSLWYAISMTAEILERKKKLKPSAKQEIVKPNENEEMKNNNVG
ncbi:hypothetical protein KSF_105220 [Reticulibacter mediterranei]|uniref:Uncharacterized protein n=1 Tax=Reticulibacter mediterranei TaxID=2778369 RepID=A0A8J3IYX4_9CHLR|nr:hypothetical protein KSF_105220 [Reticulibacter mediterranei]